MKTLLEIKDDVCKKIFHFRYKNLLEKLSSNNHNFTETEIDHFINEVAYTLHESSSPTVKESETGEQEDKPAVTITLSFDVPTFGKFISLMRTNDELWPDFKESLMQLKDKIESWKEMK